MSVDQMVLGGRYRLGELLGRGGMAEVRRGVDIRLERVVAIKQMVGLLADDPVCQARFQREARSAASLSHPAIVSVFDSGETVDEETSATIPYLVMELVEGRTLRAALAGGEKMLPDRALELTRGVLDALAHSHDAGIVHRDIKPANVMLTAAGEVKVMDFGIARAVADTSTDLTQTSSVVGTAHYLSPEQARGEKVDHRSDLYSTGCLLYELLVGRPPFVGESVLSVVYQQVREDPVPPSRLDPAVGAHLDGIVLKALAKDPDERYQSARDMRTDIDEVLAGRQPSVAALPALATSEPLAPPAGLMAATTTTQLPRRARGRRSVRRRGLGVALVLLMVLLGLGGYGFARLQTPTAASSRMVTVPDLRGSTRAEATSALRAAGLEPRVHEVVSAGAAVNTILRQSPLAGSDAQAQSVVDIDVAVASDTSKIPSNLVGLDIEAARKKLRAAGFTQVFARLAKEQPADAEDGEVVALDPGEGQSVPTSQQILVSVASAEGVADANRGSGSKVSGERRSAGRRTGGGGSDSAGKGGSGTSDAGTSNSKNDDPAAGRSDDESSDGKSTGQPTPGGGSATPSADPTRPSEPGPSRRPAKDPTSGQAPATQQPDPDITDSPPRPTPSTEEPVEVQPAGDGSDSEGDEETDSEDPDQGAQADDAGNGSGKQAKSSGEAGNNKGAEKASKKG